MRASVALSPASVTAMSPGTSLSSANTMNVASRITGNACSRRPPITRTGLRRAIPSACEPDVVVFGFSQQVGLVALHLLVHGDQFELEGERRHEGVLHHQPLHRRKRLAAQLEILGSARFLDRGFQLRLNRR